MEIKRFVSYIYRYNGAQKMENAGFAKVELNRDILKIRIHVRVPGNPQDVCQVYLFTRNKDKISGILLGEGKAKNKKMEVDFQTNAQSIMEQEVSFADLKGIILKTNGGLVFASAWDDSLIDTEKFSLYKKQESNIDEIIKETELEETQTTNEDKQTKIVEPQTKMEETQVKIEETQTKIEETQTKIDEGKPLEEYVEQLDPACGKREENSEDTKKSDKTIKTENAENIENIENIENTENTENTDGLMVQEVEKVLELNEQELTKENCEKGLDDTVRWEKLMQSCPVVRPFKYQDKGMYIKIEPKELWHLPKKEWILGSNSFLLHGYYSYRYLILGKYDDQHYVIGIPGRYYNQEQDMAKMFGFEQFKPAAANRIAQGQFGYWCKEVVCDNNEYCS